MDSQQVLDELTQMESVATCNGPTVVRMINGHEVSLRIRARRFPFANAYKTWTLHSNRRAYADVKKFLIDEALREA